MNTVTRAAKNLAAGLLLSMLCGCGRGSPLDREQTPALYRGPLTVVCDEFPGASVRYRQGGLARTTWIRADGAGHHQIYDDERGRSYSWTDGRPDLGLEVHVRRRRSPPMTHWGAQQKAQRVGRCAEAGETGYLWRIHRPRNFKQGERISEACIAEDGVVLSEQQDRSPGAAARPAWRATKVVRGPIRPSVFSPPDWPQRGGS